MKRCLALALFALIAFSFAAVSDTVTMLFFYETACPHCSQIETYLNRIAPDYPELEIVRHEIHEEEAQDLLDRLLVAYNVEIGAVPMIFMGDIAAIGGTYHGLEDEPLSTSGRTEEFALKRAIEKTIAENPASPLARIEGVEGGGLAESLTLPAVLLAAAADSVNPCTFAVLVLLLGTLIVAGRKGKTLQIGIAFILTIYVAYVLMGIGIFSAIQSAGVQRPFMIGVSILAILVGLWNMKDYFAYGKWFSIEVPSRWKPLLTRLTSSVVSIPGAIVVGLLDSFLLLPCTSGPYIAILALLSKTTSRATGMAYLLLYNVIFVLPLIGIMLAVYFGVTTTARAERWRSARLGKLHLITGAIMVLIGVAMLVAVLMGWM